MCSILPFHKRRLLMKVFIESQFAYPPLVSIFHCRILNNKINLLHYRALKFVYQEWWTCQELLIKDKSVSMHHRNLQYLAIELYKVKSGNAPFLMNEIFTTRIPENSVVANLWSQTNLYNYHTPIWNRNFTYFGSQNMEYYYTWYFHAKNKKLDSSKLSL